jgi:hypothetical protein
VVWNTLRPNHVHSSGTANGLQLASACLVSVHHLDTSPVDRGSGYRPRDWTGLVDVGLAGRFNRLPVAELERSKPCETDYLGGSIEGIKYG